MDTYSTKTEDAIREAVFKKAQELDIPVAKEQIKVHAHRTCCATAPSSIDAPYIVHVNLPGYPMDLNFDASTDKQGRFLEASSDDAQLT